MYVQEFSPYLWQFSQHFGIQWNGLSYVLSFFCAFIIVRWMTLRQRSGVTVGLAVDMITYCAVGVLVGGRLGYCVFYAPDLFVKFKGDFPFWGVLALGDGGMSSFGGILGLVLAATVFAVTSGISRLYVYDLAAMAAPIGIFFGRVANFINGEFVGKPAENAFPFSFKFPTDIFQWPVYQPERLPELSAAVGLLPEKISTEQWGMWLEQMKTLPEAKTAVLSHVQMIVTAIQNGNVEVKNALVPLLVSRHPSQLYEAAGEGLFIFIFLAILWFWPRKPGVVAATFLVLYSVIRIGMEYYRMPDPFLGYDLFGWTRGQWLSGITFLVGVSLLFIWGRRETLPGAGWGQGHSVRIHRR